MKTKVVTFLLLIGSVAAAPAQQHSPTQLFDLNAYDPIPSPDGKLIAYVLTGRKLIGGSGGFGRSNLQSDVQFSNVSGQTPQSSNTEGFLDEWLPDSSNIVTFRDWHFALLSTGGSRASDSMSQGRGMETLPKKQHTERVAYLSKLRKFVWLEYNGKNVILQSTAGQMAEFEDMPVRTAAVIVPSPDERYFPIGEPSPGEFLWVYDTVTKTLANLGSLTIHPSPDWDYFKPSWNPWFADGKHLAFFSASSLYVATPDGKERLKLVQANHGGLAIPSPDGTLVAYVTSSPRPRKGREDLNFWGASSLWIVPTGDETYDLRWLTRILLYSIASAKDCSMNMRGSGQFLLRINENCV